MTQIKETKVSTTDPDGGYMVRDGKPEGFFYLDHRTVDHKYNMINDVHIIPGNVHDSKPYLERLELQIKKFGFDKNWKPLPWMPAIIQQISARNSTLGRFMPSLAAEATLQ